MTNRPHKKKLIKSAINTEVINTVWQAFEPFVCLVDQSLFKSNLNLLLQRLINFSEHIARFFPVIPTVFIFFL